MDKLMEAAAKLIEVKNLVAIALTIGFIVMCCAGTLVQEYQAVYLVVIAFYFGQQFEKMSNQVNTMKEK